MQGLKHVNLIEPEGICWDGALLWDGDRIVWTGRADRADFSGCEKVTDGKGKYLAPGLIDIHCHGIEDRAWVEDTVYCAERYVVHGETTVLPTYGYTHSFELMRKGIRNYRETVELPIGRVFRYGIAMEGPYMRLAGGNMDKFAWGTDIRPEEFTALVDELGPFTRIWAVDPDREGIDAFLDYVHRTHPDIRIALGHSTATAESCRRIRRYGVRVRTHWGDSGLAKGRAQGTPGAGGDEYTLNEPDIYAELIMDKNGIHVVPDLAKMVIRVKGPDRVCLITDGVPVQRGNKNNEAEGIWYGEDLNYDDAGFLAGSCITLEQGVKNVMTHTGYGLCHAIRMATLTPAELLGIDEELGSLEPGKIANMILIDDEVNVLKVWLGGDLAAENGKYVLGRESTTPL